MFRRDVGRCGQAGCGGAQRGNAPRKAARAQEIGYPAIPHIVPVFRDNHRAEQKQHPRRPCGRDRPERDFTEEEEEAGGKKCGPVEPTAMEAYGFKEELWVVRLCPAREQKPWFAV